jgi:hypothetical protein
MHPAQQPAGAAADVKNIGGNEFSRDALQHALVNAVE